MIKVANIDRIGGHRLRIRFNDETVGEYDFSGMVSEEGPMIAPLRDPAYFWRVFDEDGAPIDSSWQQAKRSARIARDPFEGPAQSEQLRLDR